MPRNCLFPGQNYYNHTVSTKHPPSVSLTPGQKPAAKLHRARIMEIIRLGKRAVLRIRHNKNHVDSFLVFEPRMTGLLLRVPPPTQQHVRLVITTAKTPPLIFWDRRGLGTVTLIDKSTFKSRYGSHCGPDALPSLVLPSMTKSIPQGVI